ncbi:MAG: NAD-binding protein [Bacillota bacterium]
MRILIVGGHRVAYFLTKSMASKGYEVSVLNRDPRVCHSIARNPNILVINAEHTDPRSMTDAGAGEANVVVALADNDAENYMICQLARKRFGCGRTAALVNDPAYEDLFKQLGVNVAVSVVGILGSLLEEHLVVEAINDMVYLEDGRIVVTEVVIPQSAPAVGRRLEELNLPEGAVLTTVIKHDEVRVPRGDTQLEAGDKVVLVTIPASQGRALRILAGEDGE